jgi:hypothetical protein
MLVFVVVEEWLSEIAPGTYERHEDMTSPE